MTRIPQSTVAIVTLLISAPACAGQSVNAPRVAPVVAAVQVASYPHDAEAFTQGLLVHNGQFFESSGGFGSSTLRRVDIQSGRVLQRATIPSQFFAEGIAVLGDRLYMLSWQENTGFTFDLESLDRDPQTFHYNGEGWGLTTDGASLIRSDGTNTLRFHDPRNFDVTRTLPVMDGDSPVQYLNELEWVRGEIWANVWGRDDIARIDPQTGRVKGWIDLRPILPPVRFNNAGAVTNGIAYDPPTGKIYVTGKLWPVLFEISVPGFD